jgi:hypothetical protein
MLNAPNLNQVDSGADDHGIKLNHFAVVGCMGMGRRRIPGCILGCANWSGHQFNYQRKGQLPP